MSFRIVPKISSRKRDIEAQRQAEVDTLLRSCAQDEIITEEEIRHVIQGVFSVLPPQSPSKKSWVSAFGINQVAIADGQIAVLQLMRGSAAWIAVAIIAGFLVSPLVSASEATTTSLIYDALTSPLSIQGS